MTRTVRMTPIGSLEKTSNGCCEACGHLIEAPIQVTNQSARPLRTYSACPFCFSELEETEDTSGTQELKAMEVPIPESVRSITIPDTGDGEVSEQAPCPHQFGYLKKRPKNTPIPDTCLTCQRMIQCLI